ncbi:MAG: glycosyltransferase family 9 protein [Candidatus Gastranaerophilales bacterium]|nr:glycosyltransferase family 9 protein [Candidatus Gastranaerophilales bacterium]
MKKIKKILILRLSAIGDTIHTLPMVAAIKKSYPDCEIGWVVEDKAELFVKDNPLVDHCYVLPKKIWKSRFAPFKDAKDFLRIVKEINSQKYDAVLDTQQLFKSAFILPFLNIKRKITLTGGREFSWAFSNEWVKASHKLFDKGYHVVMRNLELARHLGAEADAIEFVLKEPSDAIKKRVATLLHGLDASLPTVVLAPSTTWRNKHWPEEYWAQVLDFLDGKVNIIFTGMESDMALIGRIFALAQAKEARILAGETNLEELAEVFRHADVVVSPDSGSAHIAWAVSKPHVLTIFTATAAGRNAPFGPKCTALTPMINCYPCMRKRCGQPKGRENICATFIKPQEVIDVLTQVLG